MWIRQTAKRLLWFVTLWAAGVLSVATVSYAIRFMLVK